jgi:hypothetical protein
MKSFKVGSVVLATEQGLGYLAKSFYDNGIIDVVHVHRHSTRENHHEWYPNRVESIDGLLDCDIILYFETCFDLPFMKRAKEKGIKIVFMPMYECSNPDIVKMADKIIVPSLLDKKYYPDAVFIPVPVEVAWRQREYAKVFVHNAGNGGLGGRNGTKELLEAMKWVKSPIRLLIRSQVKIEPIKDDRIEYRIGTFEDIWSEGDVFVFPEKFIGLSLPIQEAFASGMLVMATNRFPNNAYLPAAPLIPVTKTKKERIAVEFECAEIDPKIIAVAIDTWYNSDITAYSLRGKEYGETHSWKSLKDQYLSLLQDTLTHSTKGI